ncbi:TetR/AcrR family transcriptional regulator [Deminuibacter soli]|uniref:TetR/AcrR family transcriptional regulator n=1 Tax=Deminuibacter soli TaxID=2291815 RepID=A0A3E1NKY3_9BACT|nr:TetR/AcrR family transcriptional regulator [Deminuibacter soli]RFM28586.1 TetR/AcrR family transcriptional regulator [Deminuibacter soli]
MNLDKRSHILNTARHLFASGGYEGTSIRDIAEQAKVNISAISYYFGSKDKLLEAMLQQGIQLVLDTNAAIAGNEELSYPAKINLFITALVHRALAHQAFYRLVMAEQITNKNPVVSAMVKEIKGHQTEILSSLIYGGQQTGYFLPGEHDVLLLFNTMLGTITQTLIDQDEMQDEAGIETKLTEHIKAITRNFLGGSWHL